MKKTMKIACSLVHLAHDEEAENGEKPRRKKKVLQLPGGSGGGGDDDGGGRSSSSEITMQLNCPSRNNDGRNAIAVGRWT